MAALIGFLRNTPAASLRDYFQHSGISLAVPVNWNAPEPDVVRALMQAVDEMDDATLARVVNDAERVTTMTDEAGQAALYAVSTEHYLLDDQANGHARAVWLFINHPDSFRHAEEVRYADDKRYGRMWDAFVGQSGCLIARDTAALSAFERAIGDRFGSRNVELDICHRSRPATDGADAALVHMAVYREGRTGDVLEFVDGRLARRAHKPVIEVALTYEPATGVIEVVAAARETREELVRLLAEHLLGTAFNGVRVPLRQYTLDQLQQPFDFPTDAEDNIESVRVTSLRLVPIDTQAERVVLECMRGAERTIWKMAEARLAEQDVQLIGYRVSRVRFTIKFRPVPGVRGGRTLSVAISMPQGCDLKDRTEHERLIGEKYLRRWRLLRDV